MLSKILYTTTKKGDKAKRRKYYHRTIVVKDIFSGMYMYTVTVLLVISAAVLVLGKFNIKPNDSYVVKSFKQILAQEPSKLLEKKNIYDLFSEIIPLVKSSDEMMKKYEAFYGGVKRENSETKQQKGFLDGKKVEITDMSKQGIVFNNATTYPMNLEELKNMALKIFDENTRLKKEIVRLNNKVLQLRSVLVKDC